MEDTGRGSHSGIKEYLLRNPKKYSFFQAIRLLRQFSDPNSGFEEFLHKKLRITPLLSLAFPSVDVHNITETGHDEPPFHLVATFLGLYGPASPLPTYYTEELLSESLQEKSVKKDFLDIFNDPFFKLFYKCWSKYNWLIKLIDENDPVYHNRLYCLLGLGSAGFQKGVPEKESLLRYVGLYSQFPRTAYGLRVIVRDLLGVDDIRVRECVPRTVRIPAEQRCCLGVHGSLLGENSYLGQEILDMTGKIGIELENLSKDRFHSLLPGSTDFARMGRAVNFYCRDSLQVDVSLGVEPAQVEQAAVGGRSWSALGYNMWIFSSGYAPECPQALFRLSN